MEKTCKNCRYSDYEDDRIVFDCKIPGFKDRVFAYYDNSPCIYWQPKEAPMKIEILKPVTVKSVSEVCEEAGGKLAFWILRTYPSAKTSYIEDLDVSILFQMPDRYLAWLETHGFICREVEFEPFEVPCKVNSVDALECLYDVKDSLNANLYNKLIPYFGKYKSLLEGK